MKFKCIWLEITKGDIKRAAIVGLILAMLTGYILTIGGCITLVCFGNEYANAGDDALSTLESHYNYSGDEMIHTIGTSYTSSWVFDSDARLAYKFLRNLWWCGVFNVVFGTIGVIASWKWLASKYPKGDLP